MLITFIVVLLVVVRYTFYGQPFRVFSRPPPSRPNPSAASRLPLHLFSPPSPGKARAVSAVAGLLLLPLATRRHGRGGRDGRRARRGARRRVHGGVVASRPVNASRTGSGCPHDSGSARRRWPGWRGPGSRTAAAATSMQRGSGTLN